MSFIACDCGVIVDVSLMERHVHDACTQCGKFWHRCVCDEWFDVRSGFYYSLEYIVEHVK